MRSVTWPAARPAPPAPPPLARAAPGTARLRHGSLRHGSPCAGPSALGLAACSGGPASNAPASHSSAARSSDPAAPAQPSTGPAAEAAVKAMWQTFFNGAVPIPRRLGLLQNGQRFASFVHSEEKTSLGTLVLSASARVSAVTLHPPARASVIFTILLGWQAAGEEPVRHRRVHRRHAGRSPTPPSAACCTVAYGKTQPRDPRRLRELTR